MDLQDVSARNWDLIVVGAGSAGSAVATRMAHKGRTVLLLEAGPDYRSADMPEKWRSHNPLRALLDLPPDEPLMYHDLLATRTDAQAPALYWRGRGVGGSSAINGQIAIRPPLEEYEDWVRSGCAGWGPDDVLPYFNRLETDELYGSEAYHGDSGPIPIYRMPRDRWGHVDSAFATSAQRHGFDWTDDINAPGATGLSTYPINSRNHQRVSSNDAYLEPNRDHEKLTILGDATVDRVLFDGTRATGVHVIVDGAQAEVTAQTVVLSAGSVHTPTILIRSGIGPAARLAYLGVDCLADLPVGEGLQDHAMIQMGLALSNDAAIKTPDERQTNAALRYTTGVAGTGFNDMLMFALNQNSLAMEFADTSPGAGAICVWLNQPLSRGQLLVSSLDPFAQPFLRLNMLSEPADVVRLRDGVRRLVEICTDPAVRDVCAVPIESTNPELFTAVAAGDDALDAYILLNAVDTQHGTSTSRMGDPTDATTVVDSSCRVLGTDGLRVIDASVFPFTARANTHLASVMVGEKMADQL